MSDKEYQNAQILLTPVTQALRSELFFKMTHKLEAGNWVVRGNNDITRNNFLSGKGPGWIDPTKASVNVQEINNLRAVSAKDLDDSKIAGADVQKRILDTVIALKAQATATSRAWLGLFDQVYTFKVGTADVTASGVADLTTAAVTIKAVPAVITDDLSDGTTAIVPKTGIPGTVTTAMIDASKTIFAWNIGTYFARKAAAAPLAPGTDAWAALIEQPTGPKYEDLLERGANNEFLVKQADGTTKPLDQVVKGTSVCAQSGQTGTDVPTKGETGCSDRIMNCTITLGENADGAPLALSTAACATELDTADIWKITKDDIKAINPVMVFKLIRNLGFKGVQDKTTKLITVEDYATWAKKVEDNKLTKDDGSVVELPAGNSAGQHDFAKTLVAKPDFKNYATALIGYINSNPAILNGKAAAPKKKDAFGVEAALGNEKLESLTSLVNQARDSIVTVHGAVGSQLAGLPGIAPTHPSVLLGLPMFGGEQQGGFLSTTVSTRKVEIPKFTDKLKDVYQHYVNRLSTMNKELSPATKTAVEAVFDSLAQKESQLALWVDYLHKYSEVMRIEQNTDADKLVGEAQLKEAYEKYEKTLAKYHKRSVNMIDILATLYTATEDNKKKAAGVPLTM